MNTRYTKLDNGDIVFPTRGIPPKYIEGYTQDPGDPYLFHLNYRDCVHRQDAIKITPCKKKIPFRLCSLKGIKVDAIYCQSCQDCQCTKEEA
jgi:hypothetical protein